MKNLLLIASVEDDWYEGERIRREVEQIWYTARRLTIERGENDAMSTLEELRSDMDELAENLKEDAPEEVDEDLLIGDGNVIEDLLEDEELLEDPDAVREAEVEVFGPDVNIMAMLPEQEQRKKEEELARARASEETTASTAAESQRDKEIKSDDGGDKKTAADIPARPSSATPRKDNKGGEQ